MVKSKSILKKAGMVLAIVLFSVGCSTEKELPRITNNTEASHQYGAIVWYDLITPNIEKSKEFYTAIFDWEIKNYTIKGQKYAVIYKDDIAIGGMVEIKSAEKSIWIAAQSVKDVSMYNDKIVSNGGKVIIAKTALPGRGTFSIIEGSQGEKLSLINSVGGDPIPSENVKNQTWLWLELWSENPEESIEFYKNTFALEMRKESVNNLPYWYLTVGNMEVAGIIKNPITNRSSQWVPYVKVSNFDAIIQKIETANGYFILKPNADVSNKTIAAFQDPLGATVCLQIKN